MFCELCFQFVSTVSVTFRTNSLQVTSKTKGSMDVPPTSNSMPDAKTLIAGPDRTIWTGKFQALHTLTKSCHSCEVIFPPANFGNCGSRTPVKPENRFLTACR